jgi:hypothetical protein
MPEPSLTSFPQKAHFFGTYISGYRTPSIRCLWNSEYKDGVGFAIIVGAQPDH